jgi:transcription elongation factor Elf1
MIKVPKYYVFKCWNCGCKNTIEATKLNWAVELTLGTQASGPMASCENCGAMNEAVPSTGDVDE